MTTPGVIAPPASQGAPLAAAPDSSEALALYTLIAQQPFLKGLTSQ
jgi:hypothetical protein